MRFGWEKFWCCRLRRDPAEKRKAKNDRELFEFCLRTCQMTRPIFGMKTFSKPEERKTFTRCLNYGEAKMKKKNDKVHRNPLNMTRAFKCLQLVKSSTFRLGFHDCLKATTKLQIKSEKVLKKYKKTFNMRSVFHEKFSFRKWKFRWELFEKKHKMHKSLKAFSHRFYKTAKTWQNKQNYATFLRQKRPLNTTRKRQKKTVCYVETKKRHLKSSGIAQCNEGKWNCSSRQKYKNVVGESLGVKRTLCKRWELVGKYSSEHFKSFHHTPITYLINQTKHKWA